MAVASYAYIGIIALVLILLVVIIVLVALSASKKNTDTSYLDESQVSYFDGSTLQLIGWRILTFLLTLITLGIAFPWAFCMMERWEAKHTVYNGRRLKFNGKGIQLLGRFLLWSLLTVITFGIYSIWFGLGLEKWKVKHTVYADDETTYASKFTGGAGGWFVNNLFVFFITLITFGIATPWAQVHFMKWKASHTVICGSPLVFSGTGGQLFVKYFLLGLLTPLTLGIYAIFYPVIYLKWLVSHTDALYRTAPVKAKSKEHEESANLDFAKFKIEANNAELAKIKSGINGNETDSDIERLAESNPFAQYTLALKIKGENTAFEGRALELLKSSADAKYYNAMFDYAMTLSGEEQIKLLEDSAKGGNTDAPWILKEHYENKAFELHKTNLDLSIDALKTALYWFKVAINEEHPVALNEKPAYDKLVETLAIWYCGTKMFAPKSSNGGFIAVVIILAFVLTLGLGVLAVLFRLTTDEVSFGGAKDTVGYEAVIDENMIATVEPVESID